MTAILREDPPELSATPPELPPAPSIASSATPSRKSRTIGFSRRAISPLRCRRSPTRAARAPRAAAAARPCTATARASARTAWPGSLAARAGVGSRAAVAWPRQGDAGRRTVVFSPALPWQDADLASPAVVSRRQADRLHRARPRDGDSIVVRSLDALQAQPLKGTAGARAGGLFWSPDGRSLGFFAGGKLKTIELATGKIDEVADAPSRVRRHVGRATGPSSSAPDERAPIFRVSAGGGDADARDHARPGAPG